MIADETTQVATKQRLAVCVRYVDPPAESDGDTMPVIRENVVGLVNPSQTTGKHSASMKNSLWISVR